MNVLNTTLLIFNEGSLRSGTEILKIWVQREALGWCFLYPRWSDIGKYFLLAYGMWAKATLPFHSGYTLLLSELGEEI